MSSKQIGFSQHSAVGTGTITNEQLVALLTSGDQGVSDAIASSLSNSSSITTVYDAFGVVQYKVTT